MAVVKTESGRFPETPPQTGLAAGLTSRAVGLGAIFSVLLSIWACYSAFVAQSSHLTISHLPVAALLPFIITVFGINGLLRLFAPRRVLSPPELIVVFFIVFTASALPAWAFTTYWVSVPSIPHYFASPENRWVELFFDVLPAWLVVPDDNNTLTWFWTGLPSGQKIPWVFWMVPMFWWATFFLALFFVSASLMVILRKQWIEYERLSFPLAQVPLMLVEEPQGKSLFPRIAQNRLFWIGCLGTLSVMIWNCISYFQIVPPIPLGTSYGKPLVLARAFPNIKIVFNFMVISITYFTDLNILFSIWFFFLLSTIQIGVMNRFGVPEANSVVNTQHVAGLFVYVVFGLWMARRHLKAVFLKAIGRAPLVDDSQEFFTYRKAVLGMGLGLLYMMAFLYKSGMTPGTILFLTGATLFLYIGVTRVVAESGLIFLDLPNNANNFTVLVLGSSNLSRADLVGLTLAQTFARNWRTLGMASMAHVGKVGDEIGGAKRGIFPLIIMALVIGAVTGAVYTIYLGYHASGGAYHFGGAFGNAKAGWNTLDTWINNQESFTRDEFIGLGWGALLGWLLILAHHRFPWWPLHPIGYGVARAWATTVVASSIFLIWLVKAVILKVGGVRLYRKSQPFFLGMLVGYVIGVALSFIVDIIWFPNNGHVIETW